MAPPPSSVSVSKDINNLFDYKILEEKLTEKGYSLQVSKLFVLSEMIFRDFNKEFHFKYPQFRSLRY